MNTFQEYESNHLNETAIVFGEHQNLVGVVATPSAPPTSSDFAVLILTAGMLPSSGPFRLHVDLARSLANEKIPSLRFDLSGIGDSLAAGSSGSSLERAANEISAAIDGLKTHCKVERVALFGLCSGADDALYAALQDKRIVGLFCVDGCGYRTRKFYAYRWLRHYLPRLTSPRYWQRRLKTFFYACEGFHESLQPGSDVREFPDRETAAKQLTQLVNRDVMMHFHYTGGIGQYYNYEQQFQDMFMGTKLANEKRLNTITTSFAKSSDHVAFLLEHRAALVQLATKHFKTVGEGMRLRSSQTMVQAI